MSLYVDDHKATLCRGDYRPAALYKGDQFIGGAVRSEPVAVPGRIEWTYNDAVEVAALGRGRQETTTGAQLFDCDMTVKNRDVEVSIKGDTISFTGVASEKDPTYSVNIQITNERLPDVFVPGALINVALANSNIVADIWYNDGAGVKYTQFPYKYKGTEVSIGIRILTKIAPPPGTEVNEHSRFIVFHGETVPPFEPYTGGIPAPNPDYPMPLITAEAEAVAQGRNMTPVYKGTTNVSLPMHVIPGVQYTISGIAALIFPENGTVQHDVYVFKDGKNIETIANGWKNAHPEGRFCDTVTPTLEGDALFLNAYWGVKYTNLQVEIGDTAHAYTPYRPPTQIQLPTLRGIPDGNGGWAARDSLTPVVHQPGWYDLIRQVGVHTLSKDDKWSARSEKYHYKSGAVITDNANTKTLCTHYARTSYWGADGIFDGDYRASEYGLTFCNHACATLESWLAHLQTQELAGTPVTLWYPLLTPTTERIYLGPLKSTPHLTTLTMTGDYPPEVTATALVVK